MRSSALVVLAVLCALLLLLAQGEPTGDVIETVRSESGTPLAEAEVTARADRLVNVDSPPSRNDYPVSTGVRAYSGESTMCPNCLTNIAMALGGAGSAVLLSLCSRQALAAAGIRFQTGRATEPIHSITEETR